MTQTILQQVRPAECLTLSRLGKYDFRPGSCAASLAEARDSSVSTTSRESQNTCEAGGGRAGSIRWRPKANVSPGITPVQKQPSEILIDIRRTEYLGPRRQLGKCQQQQHKQGPGAKVRRHLVPDLPPPKPAQYPRTHCRCADGFGYTSR